MRLTTSPTSNTRRRTITFLAVSLLIFAAAVVLQIALGIWTLLAQVPLSLGLAHQFGAAILFSIAVWHVHALKSAH